MTAPTAEIGSARLLELAERLDAQEGYADVVASLLAGHGAALGGVWGSSCALVAANLLRHAHATLVVVAPRAGDVDDFCDELALFTPTTPEKFPAWEVAPGARDVPDEAHGERLRLLKLLAQNSPPFQGGAGGGSSPQVRSDLPSPNLSLKGEQHASAGPRLIVTSIQALLQPAPPPDVLAQHTRRLRTGDEIDPAALARWLAENSFQNTTAVELPGEFSPRGGIIDVFALDWSHPVRIELFGDAIESIRRFEVSSQRSLDSLDSIDITVLPAALSERQHLAAYLPPRSWFLLIEPHEMQEEARHYRQRLERPQDLYDLDEALAAVYRFPSATAAAVASGSMEAECQLRIESVERFSGDIAKVRDELDTVGLGYDVHIVCPTEAEIERLREIFSSMRLAQAGQLHFPIGRLQAGFRLVGERIVLVSSGELFHRTDLARPSRRRLGRVIDSFLELREGDYVVHLSHGIGRYRGLKLLEKHDLVEEHLEVEFHGGTRIFVPASNIDLVQKYIGGNKARPSLARIGGRLWERHKQAAQQAVTDLAADMLRMQALRQARPGITFLADTQWQREFDAAFPYRETPDQLSAITAIKRDMQQPRPMDRLLCGDVGYGKTELAIRSAFKAVDGGFQVAVLVPTTILAEQHRRTFTSRMAEFPFRIEVLSRFCTARQQDATIAGLRDGSVDIVIGTHRLAQSDVSFQNLGLLVIDEEQRFGVEVKERLKSLRATVDVLTMTATPIPRTLHMSLLGLRDISNLETPPEDRLAVETRVTRFDDQLIRHAILRELNRNGQVFFVHNRISDIELVASKLDRIVPEARIRIGHGQMPEHQLEQVMLDFVDHRFDVLLATTIVESGLDIPNANTMFIDEADHYGLADLHQLRGRVGRYKHRAYCYLLIDPNKYLSTNSAKRLRAIEEFSDMGAGFAIAMRDLEIRGAGNILGTQQSGHIATVGYELYCELLDQSVRRLQRLPPKDSLEVHVDLPGEAFIPRSYVPDMRMKIDLYRRLSRIAAREELADITSELLDRFGPLPPPVGRMLKLAELRIAAAHWKIDSIGREEGYVVLQCSDRLRLEELARLNRGRLRIVEQRSAYLPLDKRVTDADALLATVESILHPR